MATNNSQSFVDSYSFVDSDILCFFELPSTRGHRLSDIAANGSRIRLRRLPAHGEFLRVTVSAPCLDVPQPANVAADFAPKFSLDLESFNRFTQNTLFLPAQFRTSFSWINAERGERRARTRTPDTIDCGEGDLEPLVVRNGNTSNTHIQ